MTEQRPDFWFPVKSYGWGWGMPVKLQGWLVLLGYFGFTFWGIAHFKAHSDVRGLLIYMAVITLMLIFVVYMKGERPARWRWGDK